MPAQIPIEFVFTPNWWHKNCGISFAESFYFDTRARIDNDVRMRRFLYERFGWGEPDPEPRPVLGSMHVAGGFVIPALFGLGIRFAEDAAPWPVPADMSREEVLALDPPVLERTWPMPQLMSDAHSLRTEYGCVIGDFNTDGILNMALHLRGQELFTDMYEDPGVVRHLVDVIEKTIAAVAEFLLRATGTCSVAVNRSILNVAPRTLLQAGCSVEMISPALYERFILPAELRLAERFRPYGVHHCGGNMHLYAPQYARLGAAFFDVGWGSDVAACRKALPDAFLNLRLSPVRVQQNEVSTVGSDVLGLLQAAGELKNIGLCCINLDYGTPDENVTEVFRAAREFPGSP